MFYLAIMELSMELNYFVFRIFNMTYSFTDYGNEVDNDGHNPENISNTGDGPCWTR